jgi:hypothetical protein
MDADVAADDDSEEEEGEVPALDARRARGAEDGARAVGDDGSKKRGRDDAPADADAAPAPAPAADDGGFGFGIDMSDLLKTFPGHAFVPLDERELVCAEKIAKCVDEKKKHLIRLLVKRFGVPLAEDALRETMKVERAGGSWLEERGRPPRRRSAGGVFISLVRKRAEARDGGGRAFKAVMKQSAGIDKLLREQKERDERAGGGKRARTSGGGAGVGAGVA